MKKINKKMTLEKLAETINRNTNSKIEKLAELMTERFDHIEEKFDGVGQEFEKVYDRFDKIDSRFDGVETTMAHNQEELSVRLTSVEKRTKALEVKQA